MSTDGSQSGMFNAYATAQHLGRRFSDDPSVPPQAASSAYGDMSVGHASGFASPALSMSAANPALGSTSRQPSKEISLSLLQALLKPQPAGAGPVPPAAVSAQMSSASQSPMPGPDTERVLSRPPNSAFFQQPGDPAVMATGNTMEQLKRMVAAQSAAGGSAQYSTNPAPPPQTVPSHAPPQLKPASVQGSVPQASAQQTGTARPAAQTKKRTRPTVLAVDLKKVARLAKPETVPISLLQQPTRFRQGRLVSVSGEYICYAVRSKEGGHIRVIHQLQGQRVKMLGHTDSIIDMEFHPSSREGGAHQVLASVGKDNRLIVWLVGPVDTDATSTEGAIAYEPFVNIDSGGDARFTCLAWRSQIVENTIELCVGTDKGFMVMKAPAPSTKGKMPDPSNAGLNVMPVATESAVTAIARAGLHWVVVATADHAVRIYQLDGRWESSSQPHRVLCELPRGEHPVDTVIYVPPVAAADGTGHLFTGSSMNKSISLWWLGNSPQQIALLQTTTLTAAPAGPARSVPAFAKLAWSDQTRCLVVGASHAPSAMFVFQARGHGAAMQLNHPQGYDLGDEQPTLSIVTAQEQQGPDGLAGSVLSIYGVHARLVQQLQIPGLATVSPQDLPDPADIYADPSIMALFDTPKSRSAHGSVSTPAASAPPHGAVPGAPSMQAELAAALSSLGVGSAGGPIKLDPESEERLVERIAQLVETRVAAGVAAAMEQTLIPAYSRATAAMFEQVQSTFEAGLREWWARFAQAAGPPPPPPAPAAIAPSFSHMGMAPLPQLQSAPQNRSVVYEAPGHTHQQQHQQHQQQYLAGPHPHQMTMPQFAPSIPQQQHQHQVVMSPPGPAQHIDALKSILNHQNNTGGGPPRTQPAGVYRH